MKMKVGNGFVDIHMNKEDGIITVTLYSQYPTILQELKMRFDREHPPIIRFADCPLSAKEPSVSWW